MGWLMIDPAKPADLEQLSSSPLWHRFCRTAGEVAVSMLSHAEWGGSLAVAVHQLQCLEICHQPTATKAGGEEAEAAAFDSWDLVHLSNTEKNFESLMGLLQQTS